jgi:hypothetical protein
MSHLVDEVLRIRILDWICLLHLLVEYTWMSAAWSLTGDFINGPGWSLLNYIVVIYCCVVMVESSQLCTMYNMDGLFCMPVILSISKCIHLFENWSLLISFVWGVWLSFKSHWDICFTVAWLHCLGNLLLHILCLNSGYLVAYSIITSVVACEVLIILIIFTTYICGSKYHYKPWLDLLQK